MSNAEAPEEDSILNAVVIPTTNGPISILHLFRQVDAPVEQPSGVLLGSTYIQADFTKSYDSFVKRPHGLVHRLFGATDPKPYVLHISSNIGWGESWQLPVMLAHALEHAGEPIVQEPSTAKRLIWATGTISTVDYAIGGVGHVSEKLRLSRELLKNALGVGSVEIFVSAEDRAAIEPDVAEWLSELGLQISFVRTLDECLTALGLRTIPKAASRPSAAESRWKGNPYRGLKAFLPEHRRIFFGRARAREEALARLQKARARRLPFLLVTGRSGVGKSSFVQAGLLGDFTEQFPNEINVRNAIIRPSFGDTRPAAALLAALENFANEETSTSCKAGEREMPKILSVLQERVGQGSRYVLVIDQLEELFTDEIKLEQVVEFDEALDATVRSNTVWTIATLRADALGLLDRCPKLARLSEEREYRLREPSVFELSEIIAGPAAAAGRAFEDRTVPEELAQIATKSTDSLPVLQAVLYELFDNAPRDGGLSIGDLDRLGGFAGAVANWADASRERIVASGVSEEAFAQQLAALVRIEPETKVALTKTIPYSDVDPKVVDPLIADRILTADDSERGPQVRLSHDILTTRWPYLASIVGRLGEAITVRDDLDARAAAWEQSGRPPEDLVRGARLAAARAFLDESLLPVSRAIVDYVEASKAQSLGEEAQAARLAAFELKQAQTLAAASEYALKQQRRWTLAAACVSVVLAGFLAAIVVLYFNSDELKRIAIQEAARAQEKEAEAKTLLISNAVSEKSANEKSVLSALSTISGDMIDYAMTGKSAAAHDLIYSIYRAANLIRTLPVTTEIERSSGGAFNPGSKFSKDGKLVAIPSLTNHLLLADANSGLMQLSLQLESRGVSQIAFAETHHRVAFVNSFRAYVVDYITREKMQLCAPKTYPGSEKTGCRFIKQLIMSSDGERYVASNMDGTITLFNGESGTVLDQSKTPMVQTTDSVYAAEGTDAIVVFRSVEEYQVFDEDAYSIAERPSNVMRIITPIDNKIVSRDIKIKAPLSKDARVVARNADTIEIYDAQIIYTVRINTGDIIAKSKGKLVSTWWERPSIFVPQSDGADNSETKDALDIYSSAGKLRLNQNWKDCKLHNPYVFLSDKRAYLYDTEGNICLYDYKLNLIEGLFKSPQGEIFELSASLDDSKMILTGRDNTVSIWSIQSLMASLPHAHPDRDGEAEGATGWAQASHVEGKFIFDDERIGFTKAISVALNTPNYVNYAVGLKERTIYGQDGHGKRGHSTYFFAIRFSEDGMPSIAEQHLSEDAQAIVLKGGLKALVEERVCVAIWELRESVWERGPCLTGTKNAAKILPIRGGSLIGGITRDRRLLIWEPEKSLDARLIDLPVELLQEEDDDYYWSMLSSTSDNNYVAVGRSNGELRILDWRANQSVAGVNLNLTCGRAVGSTRVEGAVACLKSIRFNGDAVLLELEESTVDERRGYKIRELAWEPDPNVWRATKEQMLAFAGKLAKLGEGADSSEPSSDQWCKALTGNESTEIADVRVTFIVRAILSTLAKGEKVPCSDNEQSNWPNSIGSVVSAMGERSTETIVKIGAKDNLGLYGAGSSLVLGTHGKRSADVGATILERAGENGFRPGTFVGGIIKYSSTCTFRNFAERDPIAAGLIAQSTMGQSGLLRSVELPVFVVKNGAAELLSRGEAQSPNTALSSAAFAVSELKAFKDDSFVKRVRNFGLAAAKLSDIQNPTAVMSECSGSQAQH